VRSPTTPLFPTCGSGTGNQAPRPQTHAGLFQLTVKPIELAGHTRDAKASSLRAPASSSKTSCNLEGRQGRVNRRRRSLNEHSVPPPCSRGNAAHCPVPRETICVCCRYVFGPSQARAGDSSALANRQTIQIAGVSRPANIALRLMTSDGAVIVRTMFGSLNSSLIVDGFLGVNCAEHDAISGTGAAAGPIPGGREPRFSFEHIDFVIGPPATPLAGNSIASFRGRHTLEHCETARS